MYFKEALEPAGQAGKALHILSQLWDFARLFPKQHLVVHELESIVRMGLECSVLLEIGLDGDPLAILLTPALIAP
jgi:hypothetical protein